MRSPLLVLPLALGLFAVACSSSSDGGSSTSSSSSSGSSGSSTSSSGSSGSSGTSTSSSSTSSTSSSSSGGTMLSFDGCAILTQTEAQDVIGYLLTPCRKEMVQDAERNVWESPDDAPIDTTGSVNLTVEAKGKNFDSMKSLCGGSGSGCIDLPGLGNGAFMNLKFTSVTVKKGDAVFTAQCENPGVLQAAEDAVIQDRLQAENKMMDTSIRGDGWRNASSCSLAIARTVTNKLP